MKREGLNLTYDQVKEFHEAFSHPVSDHPVALTPTRKIARATWMREEIDEFLDADNDITKAADACLDCIYFCMGTLVEMGIHDPQTLMDMIQKANMDKLWEDGKPRTREDGKVIKPEGWTAPDLKMQEYIKTL